MSNNYSEYRTTIFPSREDRDVWVTQCIIAQSATPKWLAEDPTIEGFEPIGERCLKIWHNCNVNTALVSSLLKVNNQLSELHPQLPWIGSHHVEGNEYCFDINVNGKRLSFDSFPIMMSGGHEDDKFSIYERWIVDVKKALPIDEEITIGEWGKRNARSSFIRVMELFDAACSMLSYAKSDTQIIALYEILVNMLHRAALAYEMYVLTPEENGIFEDDISPDTLNSSGGSKMKNLLRDAWAKVNQDHQPSLKK